MAEASDRSHARFTHLIGLGRQPDVTIQMLPSAEGTAGSFSILGFPEGVHSPVAYIKSQAVKVQLERVEDLRRVTL